MQIIITKQQAGKEIQTTGDQRKNQENSDHSTVEIGKDT